MEKINVLQVITDSKIGGAEKVALSLASNLNKGGLYSVKICCLASRGQIAEEAEKLGIIIYFLGIKNKWYFWKAFRIIKLIKDNRIKIIHSHLFHANIISRVFGRVFGVVVVISTEHTMGMEGRLRLFLNGLSSFMSDKIIAVSFAVRNFILKNTTINPDKIIVVHNGIDCSFFNPNSALESSMCKDLSVNSDNLVVGTVTHLYKDKGIDYLLMAARGILVEFPNTVFLIVGDGPLRKEMESLSSKLGIHKNIRFVGFRSDIKSVLALMDVFVHPSKFEGFPITILEAMAMKKAVVATEVGGVAEVIQDNINGLLVRPRDPVSLAGKITFLLKNKEFSKELGEAARKRVCSMFNLGLMVDEVAGIYQEALRSKNARKKQS